MQTHKPQGYSATRALKSSAVTSLTSIVLSLAGCGNGVLVIGGYPLGPDRTRGQAIAERQAEGFVRDYEQLQRENKMMGREPNYGLMIPLITYTP